MIDVERNISHPLSAICNFQFVSTADDGQNVFLSPINARCLIKVYRLDFV